MTLGKLQGILRSVSKSAELYNGVCAQSPAAVLTGHYTCRTASVRPTYTQQVRALSHSSHSLLTVQPSHIQQKCYIRKLFPDPFEQDPEYFLPPEEKNVNLDLNYVPVLKNRGLELVERVKDAGDRGELGRLFAVVHIDGQQRKVTAEDLVLIHGYFPAQIGDKIRLEKVMMVGGKDFTLFGRPLLDRDIARVEATVVEKTISYSQIHFTKYKRFRRTKLLQHPQTVIVINSVNIEPSALDSQAQTAGQSDSREATHKEQQATDQPAVNS